MAVVVAEAVAGAVGGLDGAGVGEGGGLEVVPESEDWGFEVVPESGVFDMIL